MRIIKLSILFMIINFGALAIGSLLMSDGASSLWYENLNKAYWEPEGWVFGLAWTIIMFCFSVYLGFLTNELIKKKKIGFWRYFSFRFNFIKLYITHLILNISWNYLFFNKHFTELALIDILFLTLLMFYFLFKYFSEIKLKSILVIPYCIWLIIASSLNLYIVIYN